VSPLTTVAYPELSESIEHLRAVLGTDQYETLSRRGQTTDIASMVRYVLEHIDQSLVSE
jgi:hypothetical protein